MWQRGVIMNITNNGIFISTHDDTAIMPHRLNQNYQIGDCIEFEGKDRNILSSRKCERFVDFQMKRNGKSICLICDVIDITWKNVARWGKNEVYEAPNNSATGPLSNDALLNSKVSIARACGDDKQYYWHVVGVFQNAKKKEVTENSERIQYKGLICTFGVLTDVKDELYIWIPFRNGRDVMLPVNLRKNIGRDEYIGKWVTFSMKHHLFLDEDSDVRIIEDVFPTRKRADNYEIKVPCIFDLKCQTSKVSELFSDVCGTIIDPAKILDKFKRLYNFREELWVAYQFIDKSRNIRFFLSDEQDSWRERSPERSRNSQYDLGNLKITRYFNDVPEAPGSSASSSSKLQKEEEEEYNEDLENVRRNLKRVKTRIEYLTENGMEIPEKLVLEMANLVSEERKLAKETSSNSSRIDLKNYQRLATLLRDMLRSQRVREEMESWNREGMNEIAKLMSDM
ncbi:unnamed protein product [Caenorhabditis angaria]|uniref:Uncharacterized protein n=1 Tax=Caenorhabditis angaria TaxID=860376 RepID=A0A9P1IQR4_9PELO|nr:unnamed protein product [Caenorhabditis angaria]